MTDTAAETVTLTIDGRAVEARPGELVIAAAERHGVYIPRFCYHPRMKPVGMCRMCIVEIDSGRGPALQPSCMIPAAEGMTVDTRSPATKKVQDGVLEFLLINHPLDCPVCDKGGECPLQDQTLAFGPGESRFVEEKRHFEKPIRVNDLIYLDRERCVQCDRCTRFAKEVAGDPLLTFQGRGNETQINTFPDHPFSSYFSGNTAQICPVGALLPVPYRFKARPWDLEQVESTCTTCAVGCRIAVQSSQNQLLRYLGVDVDPVNWGWLCDKGRFGFEAVNHEDRLGRPLVRREGELTEARWSEALSVAADALASAEPERVGLLGGARLTNEDAYAWTKLAKGVLGTDNVDSQLGDGLPAEVVLGLPRATIDEACSADALLVLAPDVKEELPVLFLRLRAAALDAGLPIVEVGPRDTALTEHASHPIRYRPGEAARVVGELFGDGEGATDVRGTDLAPARELLRSAERLVVLLGRPSLAESAVSTAAAAAAVREARPDAAFLSALRRGNVHGALDQGMAPGILPGRVSLQEGREWFSEAWGRVPSERGLDAHGILTAAADGRIDVLVLIGADPLADFPDRDLARRALAVTRTVVAVDVFPAGSAAEADVVLPVAAYAERGGTTTNLEGRVSRLSQKVTPPGTARPDWVVAADLARRLGGDLGVASAEELWDEMERTAPAYAGVTRAVLASPTGRDGLVLPVGTVAVGIAGAVGGTDPLHDVSGAAQATFVSGQTETPGVAAAAEQGEGGAPAPIGEGVVEHEAEADVPAELSGADRGDPSGDAAAATEADPDEDREDDGEDPGAAGPAAVDPAGTRRAHPPMLRFAGAEWSTPSPAVDAYSFRLVVTRELYDLGVANQHAPSLAHLARGARLRLHPADCDRLGIADGDEVRVSSPRGTMVVEVSTDAGVVRGTAHLPFLQPGPAAAELIDSAEPVTDVRVETR